MSLTPQSKKIGNNTYEVTPLNAIKGRGVFVRFAKLVAPIVGDLAGSTGDKTADAERFAKAISGVVSSISDDDMQFFCDAFASSTCVVIEDEATGKTRRPSMKDLFGLHFASKYDEMLAWLYFCLEVNFGSFFAAAGLRRATSDQPAEPK